MTDAVLALPAAHHLQTSTGTHRPIQMLWQVDAVDGEQIEPCPPQSGNAQLQFLLEGSWILSGRHLGLQDAFGIFRLRQCPADLAFRAAVMASCLHMVKTACHGPLQGGLHRLLGLWRDRLRRQVCPALLKTHPSQRQNRDQ